MQRLLNQSEIAKIDARLHDNALLQACRKVWPGRQAEIVSVIARSEDIFCESAWLMDELIDTDEDIDAISLARGLWSNVVSDIGQWNNGITLADRYLIISTIFRTVALSFSLHWHSRYCGVLRDALLSVVDEKRPSPKDLPDHQLYERQQEELFEAIIPCSEMLNDWVNEYIDNSSLWLTEEIELALNPPTKIKPLKQESSKTDKKENPDYSRYSLKLNIKDRQLESLYLLLSTRDDKGKRFIDGELHKNNEVNKCVPLNPEEIRERKPVDIDKMLFNQVFAGKETDVCIVWTGDAKELWYFISTLYNYKVNGKRLLDKSGSGPGLWEIVRYRFMNGKPRKVLDERTGKEVETSEPIEFDEKAFSHYSKKNSLSDPSVLDAIIRKIAPPRDKNDKESIDEDTNPQKYGIRPPSSTAQLDGDFHETNHHGKNQ